MTSRRVFVSLLIAWCLCTISIIPTQASLFGSENRALLKAATAGDTAKVQALLAGGADVDAKERNGATALMLAAYNGHTTTVRALLSGGANLNAAEGNGATALMLATSAGHVDTVQALLAAGPHINARNNHGWTALMIAARGGHTAIVEALLAKGADVNVKNNNGETVLMLVEPGSARIRQLLAQPVKDTTPPAIAIASHDPQQKSHVPAEQTRITIHGRAYDTNEVASVTINDTPVTLDAQGRFTAELPLRPGDNPIVVNAQDVHGNQAKQTLTIHRPTPDTQAPEITIASHDPQKTTRVAADQAHTTLQGRVRDASKVASVTINDTAVTLDAQGRFSADVPLQPGDNPIVVSAQDAYGNQAKQTLTLHRPAPGTQAPEIIISSHDPQQTTYAPTTQTRAFIVGRVRDDNEIATVTINGNQVTLDTQGYFATDLPLRIGDNTILVIAVDTHANLAQRVFTIHRSAVDNQPPVIALLTHAPQQTTYVTAEQTHATIRGHVYDASGVATVTINGNQTALDPQGHFTIELPLRVGDNPILIIAVDIHANLTQQTFTIRRSAPDTQPPEIQLISHTPDQTIRVSAEQTKATIRGRVRDASEIASVTINKTSLALDTQGRFTVEVPLEPGDNPIVISAADVYDNSTQQTFTIHRPVLDTEPPEITMVSHNPQETTRVPGEQDHTTVRGRVRDLSSVAFVTVNGTRATLDEQGNFTAKVRLGVGDNSILVTAVDIYANIAQQTFTIHRLMPDTQPPEILLTSHTLQQVIQVQAPETRTTIRGRVQDASDIATVTVNDTSITLDEQRNFIAEVALRPGKNQINITARDIHDNVAQQTLNIFRPLIDPNIMGRYHALVIGINAYKHIAPLKTAARDATAVAKLLEKGYGFNVELLLDASRADIIAALDKLRDKLTKEDNLLIYYAGHGTVDTSSERGYWLPVDADDKTRVNWVSTSDITDTLKALAAKHVLVVADSCYSGTLVRGLQTVTPAVSSEREVLLKRLAQKRARTVLTSGGLEPVLDSGGGDHSVFAKAFLGALQENSEVLEGQQLFTEIRRQVIFNAKQTPEYADIRFAGHEGGDFLFVREP